MPDQQASHRTNGENYSPLFAGGHNDQMIARVPAGASDKQSKALPGRRIHIAPD